MRPSCYHGGMKLILLMTVVALSGCGRLSVEGKTALAGVAIVAAGVASTSAAVQADESASPGARDAVGIAGGASGIAAAVVLTAISLASSPECICSDWWARSGWEWAVWSGSFGALGAGWVAAGRRIDGL